MSYRAFKRLLGETSLERKCRFLFGAGTLLLITLSFWLYSWKTKWLAYEQSATTGRSLVNSYIAWQHLRQMDLKEWEWRREGEDKGRRPERGGEDWKQMRRALEKLTEGEMKYQVIKPRAVD